ncbi:hypothetical protein CEXT_701231 [Caerostris extrusa]|uniref:Uncharacterized protein n=1 Tax=Caerostris extrusa TaxID=172846 RepID=A0AAV4U6Q7_CAEEX|nr:hypothetical protein CEXT_701231 [Caerostris extrusa]
MTHEHISFRRPLKEKEKKSRPSTFCLHFTTAEFSLWMSRRHVFAVQVVTRKTERETTDGISFSWTQLSSALVLHYYSCRICLGRVAFLFPESSGMRSERQLFDFRGNELKMTNEHISFRRPLKKKKKEISPINILPSFHHSGIPSDESASRVRGASRDSEDRERNNRRNFVFVT